LITLARKKIPTATFLVADAENYEFPNNIDIVFSFASLIHTPKEEFRGLLSRILKSLNHRGIVRLSLKESDTYKEVTQEDQFGIRTYYYYSLQDIQEIATGFVFIKSELCKSLGQSWLEIIIQKE
jgi:hypothetical protein